MPYCSKEEALVRFFYNISSFIYLLLILLYFSWLIYSTILHFISNISLFQRNQAEYEYRCDEEEEEEEGGGIQHEHEHEYEHDSRYYHEGKDLVADIIQGGEGLLFVQPNSPQRYQTPFLEQVTNYYHKPIVVEELEQDSYMTEQYSAPDSPLGQEWESESTSEREESVVEDIPTEELEEDTNCSHQNSDLLEEECVPKLPIHTYLHNNELANNIHTEEFEDCANQTTGNEKETKTGMLESERSWDKQRPPHKTETEAMTKKLELERSVEREAAEKEEELIIYEDSCTVGSTSKSSSEWRSSINNCRDSGTDDPFSSSSRRSCPKWESYTVFQKYDEEMMFLDRISAEKLHETESLKSIKVRPRSKSERIIHKIATMTKKPRDMRHNNPYGELEAAYVAQICLTWEALNWNYKNFQSKRASKRDPDPGCPARIAQQFQQFQVLLQRYIENEPYEQGRRPEVYARMRLLAPKLLQVPEYRDSEEDQKDEGFGSTITSPAFLMIMEEGIRTFMNFLKADKEKPCQKLAAFFKRNRRTLSVDPALLTLMKKVNNKKKTKLKDLRRGGKCIKKKRLNVDEEMEILMGLIDLKVVSRVLRMADISEEQLHWCEGKMSKVKVFPGKLQRDSSPLFFPSHGPTHTNVFLGDD